MSRISRCRTSHVAPNPLKLTAAVRLMMVLGLLTAFGMAHVQIRLALSEIRRETAALQMLEGTLSSELAALRGRTEALKQPEALLEYAQAELGMVRHRPDQRDRLRMPETVHDRYLLARGNGLPADRGDATGSWVVALGERIGLTGEAVAEELDRKATK